MMTVTAFEDIQVLSKGSPVLDETWVRHLALSRYGLSGEMVALTGERDRNYRFKRDTDGACFMLKISHPAETPLIADFQTQALLHLAIADPMLPVQRIVLTLDGAPSFVADPGDKQQRVVRLFTYLPGLPMPEAPRTPLQQQNLARTLARLDIALRNFEHPAGELDLPWDIQRADSVRSLLTHIDDPVRRALAEAVLARFESDVKPVLPTLPTQPIHNDFNIYNVLVDPLETDRIAAILDFGDMVRAPTVNDLAVAAAYQIGAGDEPLADVVHFVAAYHAMRPLSMAEIDVLFTLITARLVMVVAISGWRAMRYPENAPYLLRNNLISWARLQACEQIGAETAKAVFHNACVQNREPS